MINPAYESFVNDICIDIANESIIDKIKSGWNKVLKFWDNVIKFIQKKIDQFTSFIKSIFTKKKKSSDTSDTDDVVDDPNYNIKYDDYTKISGNLYLMCVNITHLTSDLNHSMKMLKKDPNNIYSVIESLKDADKCVKSPDKYVRNDYFCAVSGNDNKHLDEIWIIRKDTLSTLAIHLNRAKEDIISVKKDLEKINPEIFGNKYVEVQNAIILCGKISSSLISQASDISSIAYNVSENDFNNLYHKF